MKNFTQSCLFTLAIMFTTVFVNQVSAQKSAVDHLVFGDTNKNIEIVSAPTAAFTTGNLVVCRVGATGGPTLSGIATAVFLDEYTTAGALVQSIALPTADSGSNQILTASGSATSECALTRSADGRYLIITGYDAPLGTAAIAGTSSATFARVIGRVDAAGNINTTTTTTSFSGSNIRSATSVDGTGFWAIGGNTGVIYTPLGGSGTGTLVSNTFINLRTTNIFGGQLYVSGAASTIRLGTVGSGTPTTTGQTITSLPGLPTATAAYNEFFFADLDAGVAGLDTLYIASDANITTPATATSGGILKFSLVDGTWTYNGTFPAVTGPPAITQTGFLGLTGSVNGTTVTLYSTKPGQLISVVDATGYNAAPTENPVQIATASTNTAFRGIAFAPSVVTAASATVGGRVTEANGRGIFRARVTLIDSQGVEQSVYTNTQGYYSFPDVPGGQTYIFSVRHLRYQFTAPSVVEFVDEDNPNINFVSSGENLLRPATRALDNK